MNPSRVGWCSDSRGCTRYAASAGRRKTPSQVDCTPAEPCPAQRGPTRSRSSSPHGERLATFEILHRAAPIGHPGGLTTAATAAAAALPRRPSRCRGMEVRGIDLKQPVDEETIDAIREDVTKCAMDARPCRQQPLAHCAPLCCCSAAPGAHQRGAPAPPPAAGTGCSSSGTRAW